MAFFVERRGFWRCIVSGRKSGATVLSGSADDAIDCRGTGELRGSENGGGR